MPEDSIAALRAIGADYRETIEEFLADTSAHAAIWRRPSPDVWSIAEYVAHAADAMEHIARRAHTLVAEDDPELARFGDPMARDYSAADPLAAVARVEQACADLARVFAGATASDWPRTGHNDLGTASLLDTAAYAVHEAGHHLYDIRRAAEVHRSVCG